MPTLISRPTLPVDRRTTLRWLAAAVATGQLAACGDKAGGMSWQEGATINAPGIGLNPDMENPVVPWPLTMTLDELLVATALSDLILPAEPDAPSASQVGVPAFLNEWVSAPYESQQEDRAVIIPGLAWLNGESRARNRKTFAEAGADKQKLILDDIAFADRVKPGLEAQAKFFDRVRALTLGAYYTTQAGWKDIGYMGNKPGTGDYAGPPPEAVDDMRRRVEAMGMMFTPP